MTESFEFPSDDVKQAKLLIPKEYDPYQSVGSPRKCYFKFDTERCALVLMADDTDELLDVLDPEDIIGASVEVDLLGNSKPQAPRSSKKKVDSATSTPVTAAPTDQVADENAPKSQIPSDTQAAATLKIFMYPRKDPSRDSIVMSCMGKQKAAPVKDFPTKDSTKKLLHRYPCHRSFVVAPAEDLLHISTLVGAIRKLARPSSPGSERLLVMVNPFAGRKKGMEIYQNVVAPMLEQAGIEHDSVVTTYAGQAEELMLPKTDKSNEIDDVAKYDALVAIGGDGTLHEILQGIKKRPDCDALLKKLKLGHIGAGTSNGLSASLAHASQEQFTATDYSFIVAKGKTVPMDLSRYETRSSNYLSFLTFSWSLIADIDIESEVLRWMGWLRMEVYSAWRVLNLRSYRAKLSYLPPTAPKLSELPPLSKPLAADEGWVTIEDGVCLLWVSQVTRAGETMLNHPQCKPSDGVFQIFLVRNTVSRLRMLLILLAIESGGHVNMHGVEFIECTAYRLEPISSGSFNDLDGEVIESGPVQGLVLPAAIRAYCKPC